jgi:hypothetical protein
MSCRTLARQEIVFICVFHSRRSDNGFVQRDRARQKLRDPIEQLDDFRGFSDRHPMRAFLWRNEPLMTADER